jgi:hypothetical protein
MKDGEEKQEGFQEGSDYFGTGWICLPASTTYRLNLLRAVAAWEFEKVSWLSMLIRLRNWL